MKIYISIPITGHDEAKVREHADRVKMQLSHLGHEAVSPFDIYAGKNPIYADYICHDIRAMLDCDAVFFCNGWQNSCGCKIEYYVASRFKEYDKKDFKIMYEQWTELSNSEASASTTVNGCTATSNTSPRQI